MVFRRLPSELLIKTITLATDSADTGFPALDWPNKACLNTLSALCLTSRVVHELATPLLYWLSRD